MLFLVENEAKSKTGKGNQFVSFYIQGNGVDFMMYTTLGTEKRQTMSN
jgi:hypothetical protein